MLRQTALIIGLIALAMPAMAQPTPPDTQEVMASEAEVAGVAGTLGKIGCVAEAVEKESADLFEVDDATYEIGQYDIKLDAAFSIISMTRD